jgi:hypothetical protein
VEGFNIRATSRPDATNIGEICVFGKHRCKTLGIVTIPSVHEAVDDGADGVLIRFLTGLAREQERKQ